MRLTTQELDKMQSVDIGATNADTLSDGRVLAFPVSPSDSGDQN